MKSIQRFSFFSSLFLACSLGCYLLADLSEVPKSNLYFTNGKFTVIGTEKYADFLMARNGLKNLNFKIENLQRDVFIIPSSGPQIPIKASGFELQNWDKLKTGANSRATVMITPNIQLTLGEKSIIQFYQKKNKFYFKIEMGNIRLVATELSIDNKYFLETSDFLAEVSLGEYVGSVSKIDGSSFICLSGSLGLCLPKDLSISHTLTTGDIYTQGKNMELKQNKINANHMAFFEDDLNFNYDITNEGLNLYELVSSILSAPQTLLSRISSSEQDEKANAQLFDEVVNFIYQSKTMPLISQAEAQAVARMILTYGKDINNLKAFEKRKGSRDDYLKELQNQMLMKADKLKELEEKLLREAKEAEDKAKAIK